MGKKKCGKGKGKKLYGSALVFALFVMVFWLPFLSVGCSTTGGGVNIVDVPPWALTLAADAQQLRLDALSLKVEAIPGDIEKLRADVEALKTEPELAAVRVAFAKLKTDYEAHAQPVTLALDAFIVVQEIDRVVAPYLRK